MKNSRLKMSELKRLTDAALVSGTGTVISSMTNNEYFKMPVVPDLRVISSSMNAFSDAIALAANGDRKLIAERNQKRADLLANLQMLGNFVTLNAGSRAALISSGLPVNAEVTVTKQAGTPQNFAVVQGPGSGAILASVTKLTGTLLYVLLYNTTALSASGWQVAYSKTGSFKIADLTPGATYSFKLNLVDKKGITVSTDLITKMVL